MTSVLHLPIMAEGHAPNLRSGPAWWDRAALESGRTALVGAIVSARRRGDRLVHTEDAEPGRPIGRIASLRVEERREGAVLMARVQFTAKPGAFVLRALAAGAGLSLNVEALAFPGRPSGGFAHVVHRVLRRPDRREVDLVSRPAIAGVLSNPRRCQP